MDADRFFAQSRRFLSRRPALGVLAAGIAAALGVAAPTPARRRRKKRCRKAGRACARHGQCCHRAECIDGACCRPERIFVACPENCRCPEASEFCCAFEPEPPATCQPEDADTLCCPPENVCGDVCCHPVTERCVGGACQCLPEYVCGEQLCCDPEISVCDAERGLCACGDPPDPANCPSGGGGFVRLRRLR